MSEREVLYCFVGFICFFEEGCYKGGKGYGMYFDKVLFLLGEVCVVVGLGI